MTIPSINMFSYHFFISSVLLHFRTIAIALKDVAGQTLSNAAGLGKEITASNAATENVFQHESNIAEMDLKPQLRVIYKDLDILSEIRYKNIYRTFII